MSLQNWVLGGVFLAVVLGFLGLVYPKSQVLVDATKIDVEEIARQVQDKLLSFGSASSPSVINGCMAVEGVERCYNQKKLVATATSTPCSIQSPKHATSSLQSSALRIGTGTSTAAAIWTSKGTTAFATSSQIGVAYTVASGAQATVVASTSATGIAAALFAPGEWLIYTSAGNAGGFVFGGQCNATFEII